jgi:hypothetical protein
VRRGSENDPDEATRKRTIEGLDAMITAGVAVLLKGAGGPDGENHE